MVPSVTTEHSSTDKHTHTHVHTPQTHTHTHTHTHTQTHTHTHTHTHTLLSRNLRTHYIIHNNASTSYYQSVEMLALLVLLSESVECVSELFCETAAMLLIQD